MREIPLSNSHLVALVDDEDYAAVAGYTWHAWRSNRGTGVWYAITNRRPKGSRPAKIRMHQLVAERMGIVGLVDHENGDGLKNTRDNLRPCTTAQNAVAAPYKGGASGLRGVKKVGCRWRAYVKSNGRQIHVGYFDSPQAAAAARDSKARELWGEFARLNLPNASEPKRWESPYGF